MKTKKTNQELAEERAEAITETCREVCEGIDQFLSELTDKEQKASIRDIENFLLNYRGK